MCQTIGLKCKPNCTLPVRINNHRLLNLLLQHKSIHTKLCSKVDLQRHRVVKWNIYQHLEKRHCDKPHQTGKSFQVAGASNQNMLAWSCSWLHRNGHFQTSMSIIMDKIGCPSGMNLYVKDAVAVAVEAVTCFLKSGHNKREIFPSMATMEIRLTISKDNKCTQTRQPRSRR